MKRKDSDPKGLSDELAALLNRYHLEDGSDTPDFVLAEYLLACLAAYDAAVQKRNSWLGPDGPAARYAREHVAGDTPE